MKIDLDYNINNMETSVNNKCKAFTSLNQSKKLAEILPLESADMSWVSNGLGKPFARTIPIKGDPEELCGCWSLAALLGVLPVTAILLKDGNISNAGDIKYNCQSSMINIHKWFDNPVDACVAMIELLHEQKLL